MEVPSGDDVWPAPGGDGSQTLALTLTIAPEWHIGANPNGESGLPTTVQVSSKVKLLDARVSYPPGKLIKDQDGDYQIYEGNQTIKVQLKRAAGDSGPLEVSVKFGACSDKEKKCLPPSTVKLTVAK